MELQVSVDVFFRTCKKPLNTGDAAISWPLTGSGGQLDS